MILILSVHISYLCSYILISYTLEFIFYCRSSGSYLTSQERSLVLQNSASLRMIWEELFRSSQAIQLQTHRIRLKSYHNCFLANELVNWMIAQNKAATRYMPDLNSTRLLIVLITLILIKIVTCAFLVCRRLR